MSLTCNVFIDDFKSSINKTLTKDINILKLTNADKERIENYFSKYLSINNNNLKYTYTESIVEEQYNVFTVDITIHNGGKFFIFSLHENIDMYQKCDYCYITISLRDRLTHPIHMGDIKRISKRK